MTNANTILSPLNHIPTDIRCAHDYELLARRFIAEPSYEYIAGGSGQDVTLAANRTVFSAWDIYPRLLRDVRAGHTRLHLLSREAPHPILLAPVAFQNLVHPHGELDTVRAAHVMQACMISSTLSSYTLEEIASAADSEKWFQLYFQPVRENTLDLVRRAERAGYSALVVTLDARVQVPSLRAQRTGFQLPHKCAAVNLQHYSSPELPHTVSGRSNVFKSLMQWAPCCDDLDWLLQNTSLPVFVKGVLHPEDAHSLQAKGVAGLVVSNHGGRSLDGAPATLDCLAAIRAVVGQDFPVLLDSGIRSGSDIFKALALGANAVLVGRLQLYALSVAGALGVAHMLRLLCEELEVCMAMAGCASLADIQKTCLKRHIGISD